MIHLSEILPRQFQKNRAFYNAASVMTIGTIPENKSIAYLSSRFKTSGININIDVTKYILEIAENIPYYIQFIASELWQDFMLNEKPEINKMHVDEAIQRILNLKSDYYWELTHKQTAYRKKILFALSQSVSEVFSKQTAKNFNLGATSSTQKAMNVLIEEGIIERKQSNYVFSDPFYKIFISRNL